MTRSIIEAAGGPRSAKLLFQGKIRSVESTPTTTAHSLGRVVVEKLEEEEVETEVDTTGREFDSIAVPFMNENLSAVGRRADGSEMVSAFSSPTSSKRILVLGSQWMLTLL